MNQKGQLPFSEKFKGESLCWLTNIHNYREPSPGADVVYSNRDRVKVLITGSRAASPYLPLSEKWITPL